MNVHPVRATILAALTLAGASLALLGLLRPGRWWAVTLGIVAVVAVAMALGRWLRVWLPGPVGLLAVVAYVTAACTRETAFAWVLPTPASVRQLGGQLIDAVDGLMTQPPLGPNPDVFLPVLLLGFGLSTLVVVALAADLGYPAVAGVVAALPWITLAVIRPDEVFPAAAVSAVVFATLLAVGGSRSSRSHRAGWPPHVVVLGLVVVLIVGLATTPLAQRAGWWGTQRGVYLSWTAGLFDRSGGDLGIDLGLGLDTDLRRNEKAVMLRTQAVADPDGNVVDRAQGLRLAADYDFDGVRWQASTAAWQQVDPASTLWPDQTFPGDGLWQGPISLAVSVVHYQNDDGRVPLTPGPRRASGLVGLEYDPTTDSARLPSGLEPGLDYTIDAYFIDERMLESRAVDVDGAGPAALAVPDVPHKEAIKQLAVQQTQGAITAYDKAKALVAYFHRDFAYNLNVTAPKTDDAVWEFLDHRSGYCVHFATAFTMMARSLGLPTRVAVGFTAGKPLGDGGREIQGGDAHAWPEIYFGGVGWVPFEPTPTRDLAGGAAPAPQRPVEASPTPPPAESAAPSPSRPDRAPGAEGDGGRAAPRAGAVVLVAASVVVVAGLGWGWRRRRRRAGLETVWRAFQRRATRWGLATPGLTVREVAARLAVHYPLRTAELVELAGLVEQARYGPPDEIPEAVDAQARFLRDDIGRATRRPRGRRAS